MRSTNSGDHQTIDVLKSITDEEIFGADEAWLTRIEAALASQTEVIEKTSLEIYCPEIPWPKQQKVLNLESDEIFFGGAVGPGKTSLLAMCALQYVHVPGFKCLILRKTMDRLEGSVKGRLRQWLAGKDCNFTEKVVTFPSSAKIQFGYMRNPNDRFEYLGDEYQLILVDEMTEIQLPDGETNPWLWLKSRLRRPQCKQHKGSPQPDYCYVCKSAGELANVPLRMIGASNPGNIGHKFVDKRFISNDAKERMKRGDTDEIETRIIKTRLGSRDIETSVSFVPALIKDNPALNAEEYEATLSHLPEKTRKRYMAGDWTVREDGIIDEDNIRFAKVSEDSDIVLYNGAGKVMASCHESECYRYATCDPAGTSKDKSDTAKGRTHSETTIGVHDMLPSRVGPFVVTRYVSRGKYNFAQLCKELRRVYTEWNPTRIRIENEKLGQAAVSELKDEMPIDEIPTGGKDKITRARKFELKVERNEWFFVDDQEWTDSTIEDVTGWTGDPDQESDIVDMLAYAAIEAEGQGRGIWEPELFGPFAWFDQVENMEVTAAMIYPVPSDKVGQSMSGGIVRLHAKDTGLVYVDSALGDWGSFDLVEKFHELEMAGRMPEVIGIHEDGAFLVDENRFDRFRVSADCYLVSDENIEDKLTVLGDWITQKKIRFVRSNSNYMLVNRLKSFPHSKDVFSVNALAHCFDLITRIES